MSRTTWLIVAFFIVLAAVLIFSSRQDRPLETTTRTDLPWLITTHDDGSSTVLDIHLGHTDLKGTVDKFGSPEGIALFAQGEKPGALEVYFGKVSFGPLTAKVVVNLAASDDEKIAMLERAVSRQGASGSDARFTLSEEDQQKAISRIVEAITYIPSYGGLEADFFRERLGEPAAWKLEDEERVLWFYPDRGVSLLLDADGKEVFQYDQPRNFVLPEGTETGKE
ncbi:hypothetical protein BOV89_01345 [Solemya velum gill symbiont]|uniref:hypothetical protein n=1 Tax=Solemya velum gill symbiont TaxID=2340 RepID=UPI0009985E3C|nr:hypothetical protein [Solemya velum gill symbiont]OOY38476.1 hypothetical protein BOV89_01345 [Solemya velum gill symbiont]